MTSRLPNKLANHIVDRIASSAILNCRDVMWSVGVGDDVVLVVTWFDDAAVVVVADPHNDVTLSITSLFAVLTKRCGCTGLGIYLRHNSSILCAQRMSALTACQSKWANLIITVHDLTKHFLKYELRVRSWLPFIHLKGMGKSWPLQKHLQDSLCMDCFCGKNYDTQM